MTRLNGPDPALNATTVIRYLKLATTEALAAELRSRGLFVGEIWEEPETIKYVSDLIDLNGGHIVEPEQSKT